MNGAATIREPDDLEWKRPLPEAPGSIAQRP
jgi:hypothetical protein